jgi:PIN domain-containing protein
MSENQNRGSHLRTKYVFIDTQALRRARFDWSGRSLSKLAEFAKRGQLHLLVTDVTVKEVKSQLGELLTEASSSLNKHSRILEQLGASAAIERVRDQTSALSTLEAAFEQFLRVTQAVNVTLISDVKGILDDYFARRPPFSSKKKAEFPDAISIASLRLWCEKNNATTYVVSEDPDLQACCSDFGPLFHVDSIAEIISQATVSQELHAALEKALRASKYLSSGLAEQIKDMEVNVDRSSRVISAARIDDVGSISVSSVNILEHQEQTFTCEVEIEADLSLDIEVELEGGYGPDDYEPPWHHSIQRWRTDYFYAEVVVRFEPSTEELEVESIFVGTNAIRVGFNDVEGLLPGR